MTKVNKIFIAIASLFGLLYVFIIPPFQAPDEVHHFYKSYQISEGQAFGTKTDNQRYGGYLPKNLHDISKPFRKLRYKEWEKASKDTILKVSQIPLHSSSTTFLDFPNVAYYAPMGYTPQAVALSAHHLFDIRPLYLFYLARIATLFCWIFIMTKAIQAMPFHQHSIAFLALLPASLFFHSGITPDALTHAFVFLLMAYLLKLALTDTPLQKKHGLLLLLSVVITINKVVYAPVFLLAWLIPVHKLDSRKNYYCLNMGLLFFHAALLFFWYKIAGDLFIPYEQYNPLFRENVQLNPDVNPMAQLAFILNHPWQFIKIFFTSYQETLPWTWRHYVGKFGWEGNYLPDWLTFSWLLVLIFISLTDASGQKITLTNWHRTIIGGIAFLMIMAFSVVIYMQWSPPGHWRIESLSGRYFIPIFPFLWLLFKNNRWTFSPFFHLKLWTFLAVFIQFFAVFAVFQRYYW